MPLVLATPNRTLRHEREDGFFVIGERINPSGNPSISLALKNFDWDFIADEALRQLWAGAQAVDVNVGLVEAKELMRHAVRVIERCDGGPLVLDSVSPDVLKAGAEASKGRVLLNSVKGDDISMKALLPVVAEKKIPFIGLAMDGKEIPASWKERLEIAGKIISRAEDSGIPRQDIVIDCVSLPLRYYPDAIFETLEAVRAVRESFGVWTCLGISNVSFGLKKRSAVNAAFLRLALAAGLDAGILNPLDAEVMRAARSESAGLPVRADIEQFKEKYYAVNG